MHYDNALTAGRSEEVEESARVPRGEKEAEEAAWRVVASVEEGVPRNLSRGAGSRVNGEVARSSSLFAGRGVIGRSFVKLHGEFKPHDEGSPVSRPSRGAVLSARPP